MGCNACDLEQANPQVSYFFRVGTANVQVTGCHEHVTEFRRIYMLGLRADGALIVPAKAPLTDENKPAHDWEWLDTVCPECGIKWRYVSPNCPRYIYNRHPLG